MTDGKRDHMEDRRDTLNVSRPARDTSAGAAKVPADPLLRPDERKARAILVFAFVVLLAGVAFLPLKSPVFPLGLQTCAFKGATGLPCPLCGGTRATHALLHGDFVRAAYMNVAAFPALVFFVTVAMVLSAEALRGRVIIQWGAILRKLRPLWPALALVFFLYWIVHLIDAVRVVKPELVDLRNPIARLICQRISDH
jgi:hypothetical protein